jgi:DNA replication protein DnaC
MAPPGTGKSHVAIALSIRACLAGQRVAFATATVSINAQTPLWQAEIRH